jgi:hypothetical protein
MGYPLSIQWQHIPRSLTAPDAWLAILLAAFLQYRQYRRRRRQSQENSGKFHNIGAKSKPKFNGVWSLEHQFLFTNLRMFVSPLPDQASELNAGMVDLQSDKELSELAKEAASGKVPRKKSPKNPSARKIRGSGEMEVRSRRILKGELVHNDYYPELETTLNLSIAVMVGLASRWLFGLLRSLRLSSGLGGPCCSLYTGSEDEGTRLPGSFEKLLACVLIKKEGDDAGNFLLSILLVMSVMNVVMLAGSISSTSSPKSVDVNDHNKRMGSKADLQVYIRIHPQKIRRVLIGTGAAIFSFWLFHTPSLLRLLGLDGLTEAMEELSARTLLFGNLLGITTLPETDTVGDSSNVEKLINSCFAFLAISWGYVASVMMIPIEETARNAAHILSPSTANKRLNPSEMMDLINVRMMLIIQAVIPVLIVFTYVLNNHFVDSMKYSARGGQRKMTFSTQYLQNSGLYVRIVLSWCFIAACAYCIRSLLQSYLDQATSVASAMGMLGEGVTEDDVSDRRVRKTDPFNDRYKNLVLTAGRIAAFPALVLGLLAIAHLCGGDGAAHPGVGYQSQPKNAPRAATLSRGLLPSYGNRYMTWTFNQDQQRRGEVGVGAGDGLLQAAALSLSGINESPFRDSAHRTIISWLGKNRFCSPPQSRSVKSLRRHVQFILDETYGEVASTINAMTGRELLDLAPQVPVTFVDSILGNMPAQGSCMSEENSYDISKSEVCEVSKESNSSLQHPSFYEMLVSLMTHPFFTPTVVFPIIDTIAFLSSVWWSYWYSFKLATYHLKLRHIVIK